MRLIDLNVQDGKGLITAAVSDIVAEARLREYFRSSEKLADEFNYQREQLDEARRLVPDLIDVVRMPNIEHVADSHNEAVQRLRAALAPNATKLTGRGTEND